MTASRYFGFEPGDGGVKLSCVGEIVCVPVAVWVSVEGLLVLTRVEGRVRGPVEADGRGLDQVGTADGIVEVHALTGGPGRRGHREVNTGGVERLEVNVIPDDGHVVVITLAPRVEVNSLVCE